MPQGTIRKLVAEKGFGFIQGERGDLFFHHSVLEDVAMESLREGQTVESCRGPRPQGASRRERPRRLKLRRRAEGGRGKETPQDEVPVRPAQARSRSSNSKRATSMATVL